LTGKVSDAANNAKDTATDTVDKASKSLPVDLDSIKGLIGQTVNEKGEVLDDSGSVLGSVTGDDLPAMAGKKVNEKGEILDEESGKVLGTVSDVKDSAKKSAGGDGKQKETPEGLDISQKNGEMVIKTPNQAQSSNGSAPGIEINVNSTKEGMTLTIKIPGVFSMS